MRATRLSTLVAGAAVFISAQALAQPMPPPSGGPPPAPPFGTPVTLSQAMMAAEAALAKAKAMNRTMGIAIVEPSGDLVYFARMEGAPYSSIQLAQGKATTSARFRRPTRAFQEQVSKGNTYFLTFNVVAAPGGVVLVSGGKLIGAIGVSGGTGDEDEAVAKAGAEAIK
jgi:uncharacterized protein GlcG (DUF336 family)